MEETLTVMFQQTPSKTCLLSNFDLPKNVISRENCGSNLRFDVRLSRSGERVIFDFNDK